MALCKQTANEFIQDCFSPMVAVLTSSDADSICTKNNLSFVELVQPFCRLTSEAYMRDPLSNTNYTIKNMHLVIKDVNSLPPQPTLAKKIMNESVYSCHPSSLDGTSVSSTINGYDIQYPGSTPWFEAFRTSFLQILYPSDHEFIKTYVACIFVVSSNHPDPLDQINKLSQQQYQQQHQSPNKLPKWFTPNIFKYYVLLHDFSFGDMAKAETIYQSMKYQYGATSCHLLQINSCSPDSNASSPDQFSKLDDKGLATKPDPWSQFLNKKPVKSDTFDSGPRTPAEELNNQFPIYVKEGSVDAEMISTPEEAVEASEQSVTFNNSENHPLTIQNHVQSSSQKKSKIEYVDEKDSPLGNNYVDDANAKSETWNVNQNGLDSDSTSKSTQHGGCLSASDIDRIRIFIHEFCVRGLYPYAERLLKTLNEQISNRKGLHKSLFSATKKWFSSGKSSSPSPSVPSNSVIYSQEALELQVRRLGDLAFMFQNYELAYQAYHTAKRDFNHDQAWFYYAGALEMAGLSVFMQGSSSQKPFPQHYLDNAISTYSSCKSAEFATRAVILSTECLKSRYQFNDAAMQYIRMTSEDSDLRSALLLEQAAYCFLAANKPSSMPRKYAFHMILAGHRYSKAGQRRHSLRSYKQALQVYEGKGWSLAEDHINFTIGRQSYNLKDLKKACAAFKILLTDESKQTAAQQAAFLREFLCVYKDLCDQLMVNEIEDIKLLPIPKINSQNLKVMLHVRKNNDVDEGVLLASGVSFEEPEKDVNKWNRLESLIVKESSKSMVFRHKLPCYSNKTNNSQKPVTYVNEIITYEVEIENVLKVPLVLTDVSLQWKFKKTDDGNDLPQEYLYNAKSNNNDKMSVEEVMETEHIPEVHVEGLQTLKIQLNLVPHQIGEIRVIGLSYTLGMGITPDKESDSSQYGTSNGVFISGHQLFSVRGPRLNNNKMEKCSKIYGVDNRLDIKVEEAMPFLEVKFYGSPNVMLGGEIKQMLVEFSNIGPKDLNRLYIASDYPQMVSFGHPKMNLQMDYGVFKASPVPTPRKYSKKQENVSSVQPVYVDENENISHVCQIPLTENDDTLEPGQSIRIPLWLQAPEEKGDYEVKLLFLYHSSDSKSMYRMLRHQFKFSVSNSIKLRGLASRHGFSKNVKEEKSTKELNSNCLHLGLDVFNSNEVNDSNITEITILQVSSVSPKWTMLPLTNSERHGVKIDPGQRSHFVFKSIPFSINDSEQCKEKTLAFSNIPLSDSEIDTTSSPCIDFYCRNKQKFDDIMMEEPPPLSLLGEPAPPSQKCLDIEAIKSAVNIDLSIIVMWKAFMVDNKGLSHLIMGQHILPITTLNVPNGFLSSSELKIEEEPKVLKITSRDHDSKEDEKIPPAISHELLKISIHHENEVSFDFLQKRLCKVPVSFVFQNCCDVQLNVKFFTHASRNITNAVDVLSNNFTWIGCYNSSFEMQPNEQKIFHGIACFLSSGTYNLSNDVLVKAKPINLRSDLTIISDNDDEYILQKTMSPSIIFICQR